MTRSLMNLKRIRSSLEQVGMEFDRGLDEEEAARAERRFGFEFPDDLRRWLMFALPRGPRFPNWRDIDDPELLRALSWPLEGLWFDVQHNAFWLREWGPRPEQDQSAFELLRKRLEQAPRLIPVHAHRYMPDRPRNAGNPVLSVYQTDIICYGCDFEDYLHREYPLQSGAHPRHVPGKIRDIEFWSTFIDDSA